MKSHSGNNCSSGYSRRRRYNYPTQESSTSRSSSSSGSSNDSRILPDSSTIPCKWNNYNEGGNSMNPAQRLGFSASQSRVNSTPARSTTKTRNNRANERRLLATTNRTAAMFVARLVPVALSVLCYLNSLHGDFVHDDLSAIATNPDALGISPVSDLLKNDFWGKPMSDPTSHKSYRPLTVLTFRLNTIVGGDDTFGFHAVNIFLHATNTYIFVKIMETTLGVRTPVSLVAATIFAVHPIHTEAVAGVVGRADTLACCFFLLSFLAYHRYRQSGQKLALAACLMCSILSMLSKEHGITVLGIIAFQELYASSSPSPMASKHANSWSRHRQHAPFPSGKQNDASWSFWWKGFIEKMEPIILTTALSLACRFWVLAGSLPQFSDQDNPAAFHPGSETRFLTFAYLLAHNVWLLLCPLTLSYDWQFESIPMVRSPWDLRNVATFSLLAATVAIAGKCLLGRSGSSNEGSTAAKRRLQIWTALLLMAIPFLPASNIFFPVGFVVAERILYIPSVGFCLLIAIGWDLGLEVLPRAVAKRFSPRRFNVIHRVVVLCWWSLVGISVAFLALRTVIRNEDWRTRETLFRSGLTAVPHNAKMHYNFANFQLDSGNAHTAEHHYREAIRLWPTYASAHNNLGTLLNDSKDAQDEFLEALRYHPGHVNALFNLASLKVDAGDLDMAVSLLRHVVELDRDYAEAESLLYDITNSKSGNFGRAEKGRGDRKNSILPEHEEANANSSTASGYGSTNTSPSIDVFREDAGLTPPASSTRSTTNAAINGSRLNNKAQTSPTASTPSSSVVGAAASSFAHSETTSILTSVPHKRKPRRRHQRDQLGDEDEEGKGEDDVSHYPEPFQRRPNESDDAHQSDEESSNYGTGRRESFRRTPEARENVEISVRGNGTNASVTIRVVPSTKSPPSTEKTTSSSPPNGYPQVGRRFVDKITKERQEVKLGPQGSRSESKSMHESARVAHSKAAQYHIDLGMAFLSQRDFREACKQFKAALELVPSGSVVVNSWSNLPEPVDIVCESQRVR